MKDSRVPGRESTGPASWSDVSAAILSGGKSTRMGEKKSLVAVDGAPMIRRVADGVRSRVESVFVAGGDEDDAVCAGCPVFPDEVPGLGPIGGLHTALANAKTPWCLVVACDMPFVRAGTLDALLAGTGPGIDAVVVDAGRGIEPLLAMYRRSLLHAVRARIDAGERAVYGWIAGLRVAVVPLTGAEALSATNVNTPDDLRRAGLDTRNGGNV